MPLYVYAVIEDSGEDGETFEILHGLNEPSLTRVIPRQAGPCVA